MFSGMSCLKPIQIPNPAWIADPSQPRSLIVPCGKCPGCLIDKRNEWTLRIRLEAHLHPFNYFITLTYDETNEPWVEDEFGCRPTVSKRDCQLFFKRLRTLFQRKGIGGFRYVIVSEYSPKRFRPHYHGILFFESYPGFQILHWISKCWPLGIVDVGFLRDGGAAYCSKYLFKRDPSVDGFSSWTRNFLLASRKPPLGDRFFSERLKEYLLNNETYEFRTPWGDKASLPRIFKDKIFDIELRRSIGEEKKDKFFKRLVHELYGNFSEDFDTEKALQRYNAKLSGRWSILNKKINNVNRNQKDL